jgi:5-methylcytosine-specific restriction endonuclease McrA
VTNRGVSKIIPLAELAERDNYTCWLCDRPVDMSLVHPHPMSASRDHIRKSSEGGSDRSSNLKLAHMVCNEQRESNGVFAQTPTYVPTKKRRYPPRPANWTRHKPKSQPIYSRRMANWAIAEQTLGD